MLFKEIFNLHVLNSLTANTGLAKRAADACAHTTGIQSCVFWCCGLHFYSSSLSGLPDFCAVRAPIKCEK